MTPRSMLPATTPVEPPVRISHPTMYQRWSELSFVHVPYEPREVRRLVPSELEIDTFDGGAWVGIVPFRLDIRRPGVPYVPWLSSFPETNVRTYVIGPDGRRGIWFLSLDAARFAAVMVARSSYRLPYMWADARMARNGTRIMYRSRRRWPTTEAAYDLEIEVGTPIEEPNELERFLTARWHLYSPGRLRLPPTKVELVRTTVEHAPWPLRAATVRRLDQTLLAAAGLPQPSDPPLAMFSRGVAARFARRVELAR